jgi:hypothetical protein
MLPKLGPGVLFNGEPKRVPVTESGDGTVCVVRPGGVKGAVEGPAGMNWQKKPPDIALLTTRVRGMSMSPEEGLKLPIAVPPGRLMVMVLLQVMPNGPTMAQLPKATGGKKRVTLV